MDMGAMATTVTMQPLQDSGVTGEATLTPMGGQTQVMVRLTGRSGEGEHPGHIHPGTCDSVGGVVAPLQPITAGADGTGTMTTTVDVDANTRDGRRPRHPVPPGGRRPRRRSAARSCSTRCKRQATGSSKDRGPASEVDAGPLCLVPVATALFSVPRDLLDRLRHVLGLREDGALELRRVGHPGVQRGDAPHGGVQPGEELVGDAGGELGADAPGERVLVRDRSPGSSSSPSSAIASMSKGLMVRRSITSVEMPSAPRPAWRRRASAAPGRRTVTTVTSRPLARHPRLAEGDHEVRSRDRRPCCRPGGRGACARGRAPGPRSGWRCAAGPRRPARCEGSTTRRPGQCAKIDSPVCEW